MVHLDDKISISLCHYDLELLEEKNSKQKVEPIEVNVFWGGRSLSGSLKEWLDHFRRMRKTFSLWVARKKKDVKAKCGDMRGLTNHPNELYIMFVPQSKGRYDKGQ